MINVILFASLFLIASKLILLRQFIKNERATKAEFVVPLIGTVQIVVHGGGTVEALVWIVQISVGHAHSSVEVKKETGAKQLFRGQ